MVEIAFWVSGPLADRYFYIHKSQNSQNASEYYETSRVCVLYDIYLGKQPTYLENAAGKLACE